MTTENSSEPKVGRITFNTGVGGTTFNPGGPALSLAAGRLESVRGMMLRDWFAGMALQGMVAGSVGLQISTPEFAASAYRLADAMLLERDKNAKK